MVPGACLLGSRAQELLISVLRFLQVSFGRTGGIQREIRSVCSFLCEF